MAENGSTFGHRSGAGYGRGCCIVVSWGCWADFGYIFCNWPTPTRDLLKHAGCHGELAGNGMEAIEAVREASEPMQSLYGRQSLRCTRMQTAPAWPEQPSTPAATLVSHSALSASDVGSVRSPRCMPIAYPEKPNRAGHWHKSLKKLARPAGLEPATPRFGIWYSIQLSYGRNLNQGSLVLTERGAH